MIASPGDVAEERKIVTEEIHRWNNANALARRLVLLPVKWETNSTPQLGDHPQTIINRQLLDEADIVVAIFGSRIGTPTEEHVSGTVEEIKKHVASGKTAKIYFSDVPVPPSSLNPTQYARLQQFREECQSTGLYGTFSSLQQFRTDFSHHLNLELNEPRYRWLVAPPPARRRDTTDVSPEALHLVKAAASTDGLVISQESLGFNGLAAGNEEFMDGSSRSAAKWRAIVKELVTTGLLEETAGEGVYRLTEAGHEIADKGGKQETSDPIEVTINLSGPPEGQYLDIRSTHVLRLSQIDYLTTSEVCITTQLVTAEGKEIEAKLAHENVVALYNSPRPDHNSYDLSGPAKLRLSFHVGDEVQEVTLPVALQPKIVGSTQWIVLTGSRKARLEK
jgi:hypothetical protein